RGPAGGPPRPGRPRPPARRPPRGGGRPPPPRGGRRPRGGGGGRPRPGSRAPPPRPPHPPGAGGRAAGGPGPPPPGWHAGGPPPPNDAFANATPLGDDHGTVIESNAGATKEPGEPDHAGGRGGTSLWFRWTAPASGQAEFTTDDDRTEVADTLLAVYTGSALG